MIKFTDLHAHSEYSLTDGMIRIADSKDPKHIKADVIKRAEYTGSDAITITDHGNMYGQAALAQVCKTFGFKHIPGCEFYMSTDTRHDKNYRKRSDSYMHLNAWAMNSDGYRNMCILQKLSFEEGYYYVPRIDKEILQKYNDGIIVSDACVGGTVCSHINDGNIEKAYDEFMWYLDLFKDRFYIEYHNHGIDEEEKCNKFKVEWANKHGVPIIACTDAHFAHKEDIDVHKTLLCVQYGRLFDDPSNKGFGGDGYWYLSEQELLERFPTEYIENTRLLADRCEGNCIKFGDTIPPKFKIPESWLKERQNA